MPYRSGLRGSRRVQLPDRLRCFEQPPPGLLRLALGDERREIARLAERVADLIHVEKEDLLAIAKDTVPNESVAEGSRGPAHVGVVASVEPVVVLLGQRSGRACDRQDFLEPREIPRPVRQRFPCMRRDLVGPPPKPGAPDLRILRGGEKALRDRADEQGRVVSPGDGTEVIARRAGLAVHAEECVYRPRERRVTRAQLVDGEVPADRIGDRRRPARGLGEFVEVLLELLQRQRETLCEREGIRLRSVDEGRVRLAQLVHDRVCARRDEHVDPPGATMPPPEVVPRGCCVHAVHRVESQRAHPHVVLVQLGQIALVPIAPRTAGETPALRQRKRLMRCHLVRGSQRSATRVVPAVEALQAHEERRPQLLVAASHPVVRTVPRVFDGERRNDLRDVRVVAAPEDLRVLGVLPVDGK